VNALVKERLTGASILVALIVLLVPELLHGPIRPAARVRGPATASEEPPLRAYTINLADESHGGSLVQQPQPQSPTPVAPAPEPAAAPAQAVTSPPAQSPAPAAPTQHPFPPPPAAAAPATSPPPAAQPASGRGGWMVQLGSFASRANAERLAQQVRARGFAVEVSRGPTGRRLYRVQVGPAHDRASAEQLAGKLRTMGHSGSIVSK
jgi:DedD protein